MRLVAFYCAQFVYDEVSLAPNLEWGPHLPHNAGAILQILVGKRA